MAVVTIYSDLEPKKIKSVTVSIVSPSICHEVMGLDAIVLVLWMLSFKPAISLSLFILSKGCLVPLHFLPLGWYICIPKVVDISPGSLDSSFASSNLAFLVIYSAYKLN